MSPNAVPIGGITADDVSNLEEVLRALMQISPVRARQVIGSIPVRSVPGSPSGIMNPGNPQFNVQAAASAAAFR